MGAMDKEARDSIVDLAMDIQDSMDKISERLAIFTDELRTSTRPKVVPAGSLIDLLALTGEQLIELSEQLRGMR